MGQILIRNLPDAIVESLRTKARLSGKSLEQTVREMIVSHAPLTSAECQELSRQLLAEFDRPVPTLSKEDIREGLA